MNARTIKRCVQCGSFSATLSLEEPFWDALQDVAGREGRTVQEILAEIDAIRSAEVTLTAAVRVFVMAYYKAVQNFSAEATPVAEPPRMTLH